MTTATSLNQPVPILFYGMFYWGLISVAGIISPPTAREFE